MAGCTIRKGMLSKAKGKTLVELYGKEKANIMRLAMGRIPNIYTPHGDKTVLTITKEDGERQRILIDTEDRERCAAYQWHMDKKYVRCNLSRGRFIYMTHLLLGFEKPNRSTVIDHINKNQNDNRKCNLRITSQQVNNRNHRPTKNGRCVGVRRINGWRAYIRVNGKLYWSEKQPSKEAAIAERKRMEEIYWGNER